MHLFLRDDFSIIFFIRNTNRLFVVSNTSLKFREFYEILTGLSTFVFSSAMSSTSIIVFTK